MNETYKAPVLYVSPVKTWSENAASIPVSARFTEVEVGTWVAMVIKSGTEVAGYILMKNLSILHESFGRPPSKFKCLDGFLGIGEPMVTPSAAGAAAAFVLEVRITSELKRTVRFAQSVRPAG